MRRHFHYDVRRPGVSTRVGLLHAELEHIVDAISFVWLRYLALYETRVSKS